MQTESIQAHAKVMYQEMCTNFELRSLADRIT